MNQRDLDSSIIHVIEQIHAAPQRLVLEFTGAGSLALYWLHRVAGSSRTLLEASDRYAAGSLADLLGRTPERFVSRATAEAMAERAYRRAVLLSDDPATSLGVGCTAAIATDRAKRGEHRCWVSVYDGHAYTSSGLTFIKGARERPGEERVVAQLVLRAVADACGTALPLVELVAGEQVELHQRPQRDSLAALLAGEVRSVLVRASGERTAGAPVNGALLSGSFNPLHVGHERLAQAAAVLLRIPVYFELPVFNADKPPLGYAEVERRLGQFRGRADVVLSCAPLFVEKAALFPRCTFVIGYDTAVRLIDPRYYAGSAGRDAALQAIRDHGCRFLVAGRTIDGAFRSLDDLELPGDWADLFLQLPEELFRVDISSTEIRQQKAE